MSSPKKPAAVEASAVSHWFGTGETRKQVLFDIDFRLAPGEITIMTGPSGSGKSTFLTLIGALRTLQAGRLRVLGDELANLGEKQLIAIRQRIGFIFQHHNLFDSLTALQNVEVGLYLSGPPGESDRSRARQLLEEVGLDTRSDYLPEKLSGGQRQRVAVARALVNRPRLILADEPTAALDKVAGRAVVDLLRRHAREDDAAIIMVTHDNRILDVADRIVNLVDGSVASDVAVARALEICEFLRGVELFAQMTPGTLSAIAERATHEEYLTGEKLIREGEVGDKFFVLRSGSVEVLSSRDGSQKRLATLGRGEFFGEVALLTGERRNATIRALGPVEVFTLGKDAFDEAVRSASEFADQLRKVLFQRQ
jgi:putative ABC transport system ATP-binding protein